MTTPLILESLVAHYRAAFAGTVVFGVPVRDLTREELMALVLFFAEKEKEERQAHGQEKS